jgi:two-component system phosphate regulon sensor histidine kinase PhoR
MDSRSSEKTKLIAVVLIALFFGFLTGYYLELLLIALAGYILWSLDLLFNFERWIERGANVDEAPSGGGIWDRLIGHALKIRKSLKLERERNTKLKVRFNEVLRSFPFPTIVLNGRNEIQWINKRAAKILSLQRKKDVGIPIQNIFRYEELSRKLKSSESSEFELKSPNGDDTLMMTISKLTRNVRIVSIRNISERVRLDASRKKFISNASHEMRTPLTIINGYLEMLKQNKDLDKKSIEMVDIAYEHGQKMDALITDLLILSGLRDAENANKISKYVNFSSVIDESIINLKNSVKFKQKINLDIDKKLELLGTEYQLYSIASNLIENAVKYSPKNSEINISWGKENGDGVFKVIDHGIGISQKEMDQVIEPFYRTPDAQDQNIEGTGLGLSIVNESAIRNNGIFSFKSAPGKGSEFKVTFKL